MFDTIPDAVKSLIGVSQYYDQALFDVNIVAIRDGCAAVQNENPMYWDESYCKDVAGAQVAPATQMSAWLRAYYWQPESDRTSALQAHFDLKNMLSLPEAIITENEMVFGVPVKVGDRLSTYQVVRSISDEAVNKLGVGRYWVLDVVFENQHGEFVGKDSYTAFGYIKGCGKKNA